MRAGAHALLPFFLACIAFVLIATLWQGLGGGDFTSPANRRVVHPSAGAHGQEDPSLAADGAGQALLRGRIVDARTGEPVSASVTLIAARGSEHRAEAGPDGIFQIGCTLPSHVTLAIPRTDGHFGLVEERDVRSQSTTLLLKLEPRRDLPVVFRTPDGRPLAEVAPPGGPWAREEWPSILVTQSLPVGRPSEGAQDPLLATRVGRFLSTVHGDVPLRPGSPASCVGYVRLFQAPPVCCNLVVGSRILQSVVLEGGERMLSFVVDPAELKSTTADLELHVIDADTGLPPVATHGIWLGMLGGRAHELPVELDRNGRVEIKDVPAGSVEVHVRLSGYENETRRVDLHAGEPNDLGDVRVHAGACVAGHLVTDLGDPVRALVWSSTRDGRDHPAGQAAATTAQADWFAVCGLPRTSVLVGIDDPRWALNPTEVDLADGSVQNARIVARKGSILRLVGPYSAGGTAFVRVLDSKRLCVWAGDNLEEEVHELTLLPGRYTIEVRRNGSRVARQDVDLAKAAGATILLR